MRESWATYFFFLINDRETGIGRGLYIHVWRLSTFLHLDSLVSNVFIINCIYMLLFGRRNKKHWIFSSEDETQKLKAIEAEEEKESIEAKEEKESFNFFESYRADSQLLTEITHLVFKLRIGLRLFSNSNWFFHF